VRITGPILWCRIARGEVRPRLSIAQEKNYGAMIAPAF
jgi:hypothetical protein